jgi:hypothetical protein
MNSHQLWLVNEERIKLISRLATTGQPQRAVTSVARNVLLNAPYFYNGESINPKAKSLGAGVYEITI